MELPGAALKGKTTYLQKRITASPFSMRQYTVKQMDYDSDRDIEVWCNIVNQAYDDSEYSPAHAKGFLTDHPFCTGTSTAFFMDGDTAFATISYGKVKTDAKTGSFFRIAVLPSYRNRGVGRMLLGYAESEMAKQDVGIIEESIALKRDASFSMHFGCGYKPEIFSAQRAIKRSPGKEIVLTLCGYNLLINIVTWTKYHRYKKDRKKAVAKNTQ
ncbi:MAG: GNAT family N-acetyltransferase [Clostridia bacterium]|nr:GNAT family N-acetyltransferase [Clostridia bacterium]